VVARGTSSLLIQITTQALQPFVRGDSLVTAKSPTRPRCRQDGDEARAHEPPLTASPNGLAHVNRRPNGTIGDALDPPTRRTRRDLRSAPTRNPPAASSRSRARRCYARAPQTARDARAPAAAFGTRRHRMPARAGPLVLAAPSRGLWGATLVLRPAPAGPRASAEI
jgi:hypothetical protein